MSWFLLNRNLTLLEPYDWKLSRTVLRGERGSNAPDLPGNMGAVAVGATIYFGSDQSRRQLVEIAEAFEYAHELGMATILWCYLRNSDFKKGAVDYHSAADLTGQANRLGVTIKANIVKQKLPTNNGGFKAIGFGKIDERMYTELSSETRLISAVIR